MKETAIMARALRLAQRGLYTTTPNPRVGCVLTKGGVVIAEGWHQKAGEAHAEINALRAATESTAGVTAYVTLEPCNHRGKTPPCTDALIKAGISRVVYAMEDPNPEVGGKGLAALEAAGIEIAGPVLEDRARDINPGFIKRMETGLPYVRCKLAMSMDGRTAMASGESKWITGPKARRDAQRLRARSCAIVTGIGSILQDDSSLTVRAEELGPGPRQPLRVVVDSNLRLPASATVLQSGGQVLVATAAETLQQQPERADALRRKGAQVTAVKRRQGQTELRALLFDLAKRQCNEVLIEAGAQLSGGFLRQGLIDELIVYMAPKLMGSEARPLFELPVQAMAAQLPLNIVDIRAVGHDWRITAKPDPEG